MAGPGHGAGLRAYVRGTWMLLGVQLILAIGLGALSFWANQSMSKARKETAHQEQLAKDAVAKVEAAKQQFESQTKRYAQAAPLIQLGVKAVAAKKPEDARKFFAQAVTVNPDDAFTRALLAQTIYDAFDPREAVAAYEDAMKKGALEPADTVRYIQALCRVGQTNDAVAAAKKASDTDPAKLLYEINQQGAVKRCPALRAVVQSEQADATAATAQSWAITRVFLEISQEEDRPRAQALQAALRDKGYDVPGIERVDPARYPKVAEIRFYYKDQKDNVDALARQVMELGAATAPDEVAKGWYAAPFSTKGLINRTTGAPLYDGAPTDQVELWLPPPGAAGTKAVVASPAKPAPPKPTPPKP